MNKNFNKEKHQLEKIREALIDIKDKKYNVELEKEELSQEENIYKSFMVNSKYKETKINSHKEKEIDR